MSFSWKQRVLFQIVSLLGTWLIKLWFASVRVKIINPQVYRHYLLDNDGRMNIVGGTWHRHVIFLTYFFRCLPNKALMVSRSKDGEYIARILHRMGYATIRGSSSRGARAALLEMIRFMNRGDRRKTCATPLDGPKGPPRHLKPGMLFLAKETDSHFLTVAASGTRVLTFSKAWDQTILPLPCSTMVIAFHPPIKIPRRISAEALESIRQRTEMKLNLLTDRIDRLCGYRPPQRP